jgi:hypothetical protein
MSQFPLIAKTGRRDLAATVEALLREIAASLAKAANRESGHDEDHG